MKRRRRIINQLRKLYPDELWHYDADLCEWQTESGWRVYAESLLTPRYDGDDETCAVQYRRSDTHELLSVGGSLLGFALLGLTG
jgi:hypothetical protein